VAAAAAVETAAGAAVVETAGRLVPSSRSLRFNFGGSAACSLQISSLSGSCVNFVSATLVAGFSTDM
jgi:hypothetical protein